MSELQFNLRGVFKPYVRMTRRGKFVKQNAKDYLASKFAIGLQAKQQMNGAAMLPGQTPLAVTIYIERQGGFHNRDLDNEVKAILDALQGIAFPDDRWVDTIRATRKRGVADYVLVTVKTEATE